MPDSVARTEEVLRAIVHEARVEKLTFMAGSIAYHAFLSILPLVLLVLTVVQRTQNVAIRDSVLAIMQSILTEESSQLLQQGLSDADASVSVLGLAFLVWGRCESSADSTRPSRTSTRPARTTPSRTSWATGC
jgi:membrane protein